MTARALPLLFLLGCAGLPAPTPEALEALRFRIPPPGGPFLRIRAEVDVESDSFAGAFHAVLVAKTGQNPVVRLQLLPDVGGKVLDLLASRERITGWFPQTGERVDVALPGEARSHPIVFIGLTLLELFAPVEGRIRGVELRGNDWVFSLDSRSGVVDVTGTTEELARRSERPFLRTLTFRWSPFVSWTWRNEPDEVVAPGFRLRMKSGAGEQLDRVDESLLRLELPVDSR